jgi:hypothetical protein
MGRIDDRVRFRNIVTLILYRLVIVTCVFTPYAMAFIQEASNELTIFE